jgi:hypothetical protein
MASFYSVLLLSCLVVSQTWTAFEETDTTCQGTTNLGGPSAPIDMGVCTSGNGLSFRANCNSKGGMDLCWSTSSTNCGKCDEFYSLGPGCQKAGQMYVQSTCGASTSTDTVSSEGLATCNIECSQETSRCIQQASEFGLASCTIGNSNCLDICKLRFGDTVGTDIGTGSNVGTGSGSPALTAATDSARSTLVTGSGSDVTGSKNGASSSSDWAVKMVFTLLALQY